MDQIREVEVIVNIFLQRSSIFSCRVWEVVCKA